MVKQLEIIMSFNPLNLNWLVISLSVAGLYLLIVISLLTKKSSLNSWIKRKIDHSMFLTYFAIIRIFNNNFYDILLIFFISFFAFGLLSLPPISLYKRFIEADTRDDEKHEEFVVTVSLTAFTLILLFFYSLDKPYAFVASILSLGLGDGLGEVVGRSYGTFVYKNSLGNYKTLEGSTAVFIGTLIAFILTFIIYGIEVESNLALILGLALIVMILEALSIKYMDNIIIPLGLGILILLLF